MASIANRPPHKKRRYGDHASQTWPSAGNDDSLGIQSLPVAILPDDFSGDPLDGEQYLAVVRREAAAAPGIFLASHNPYAISSLSDDEAAPGFIQSVAPSIPQSKDDLLLLPSPEWRSTFETQFKNARESLSNPPTEPVKLTKDDLPKIGNTSAWYAWIHGRPPPPCSPEEAEKQSQKGCTWKLREPTPALLLRLSTEQILGLLEAFPYWLAHRVAIPNSQQTKLGGNMSAGGAVLQPLHARWLFALLLRLDARLVSEEISTLRTLARACVAAVTLSRIRRKAVRSRHNKTDSSTITQGKDAQDGVEKEGDDDDDDDDAEKRSMRIDEAGAWMIVTIVAAVWGQSDLWDDAIADMKRVT